MNGRKGLPPVWFFVLAGVVFFGGLGAGAYLLFSNLTGLGDQLIRLTVPVSQEIPLEGPGAYTVFLETPTVVEGRVVGDYGSVQGLTVLVHTDQGQPIPVGPATMSQTYTFGGRRGVSLMSFEIQHSGRYRFTASFAPGVPAHPLTLTLSKGFVGRLFSTVLTFIGLVLFSILAGALLVVFGLLRWRRRSRERRPAD
ncbi:MAG: hypothetical protein V1742_11020 [Pseudomonadota bacterium]